MRQLADDDDEAYRRQFSAYIKNGVTADGIETMYKVRRKLLIHPLSVVLFLRYKELSTNYDQTLVLNKVVLHRINNLLWNVLFRCRARAVRVAFSNSSTEKQQE